MTSSADHQHTPNRPHPSARGRRRWFTALAGAALLIIVAGGILVVVAPDRVLEIIRGSSCPDHVSDTAATTRPAANATTSTPTLPPAPSVGAIDSIAVENGSRVAAFWPFSVDSPWNMPLGEEAIYATQDDPRLENLRSGRGFINIDEFSIEIFTSTDADPLESVEAINNETVFTMRIPPGAEPSRGSDGNLDIVQPDGVTLWENWIMTGGLGDWQARYTVAVALDGDGISAGVRAYGGSTAAGLVRGFELEEGEIRHAIAMALCPTQLRNGPVWPATTEDGGGTDTGEYSGLIPMGTLLAIPPSIDVAELGLSRSGQAIARAYQRYGGYVTDSAGSTVIAFVEPSTPDRNKPSSEDAEKILAVLRVVENSGESMPGGPGTRLAALAPPLQGG